jgi:hypothetical protein
MKLGVINRDEYRQYRYWQIFQKILLPCAAGFTVAGFLLDGSDLRSLSQIVGGLLWALFLVAAVIGGLIAKQMVRRLPSSLQSLLMFSTEGGEERGGDERDADRATASGAPEAE